jgi:mycobactin polyketide synthetase MbtD
MTTSSYHLPDGTIPVVLSSDAPELLHAEAAALLSYAVDHPDVAPEAIANMLFRTRTVRRHRALAMVTNRDDLLTALRAVINGREHPSLVRTGTPAAARRVAYVFPGQGVQRPGMGRLCYESIPAFRAEVDHCVEAFRSQLGESPLNYLLDEDLPAQDDASTVQPALFTQMAGLAAMWRSFGIAPGITIGHSQGEIAAAYVSGVITLADAVRTIGIRARAADEFAPGDYAVAIIAADRDACEDVLARCSGWAQLSVVNAPNMLGISGDRGTVQSIVDTFTERDTFARVIRVQYPAHTSLINKLRERLCASMQHELQNSAFLDTGTDCVGATLGGLITPDLPAAEYWFWNLRNTVRFDKAIATAVQRNADTFIELAEHPTLQSAIDENLAALTSEPDERTTLVAGTTSRTAMGLGEFTRNLALLAVHDLDYQWDHLRTESAAPILPPLLDFPNTRMHEIRLWLPYHGGPVNAPAKATSTFAHDSAEKGTPARLLVEQWIRLSHRSLVPPRAIGIVDHTGACPNLVVALCTAAGEFGATACLIDSENTRVRGDLDTLVILVPPGSERDDCAAAAAVAAFFSDRGWWPGLNNGITDCWLVTVGGETVVADDAPPDLVHAAASAGFRSVGAEYPGVRFRHLDLPSRSPTAEPANMILAALHTGDEPELALRIGGLYAKRVTQRDTAVAKFDSTPPEHVLITGGTGNLGLEFCDHFARRGARRITLVSRSGEKAAGADRLQRIRSACSHQTQIRVTQCDIGDHTAVSRLAAEGHDMPADLIIHAAVDYSELELADITTEKVDRALRAKVIGIRRILATFPRTDNCRVILCSSIAATLGGRGQIVYAAANRMLDAMAHRLRADGLDCVSVQWGQWTVHLDLGASGTAKLTSTGIVPMRPADALALGVNQFHENALVAAFDLARARPILDSYGYGPLLSQLTSAGIDSPAATDRADLSRQLTRLLAKIVGDDDVQSIDTQLPMVAIGLDSIQALEFRRCVKTELNHDLAVSDLLGGASIADVVAQLDGQPQLSSSPAHSYVPAVDRAVPIEPADIARRAQQTVEQSVPSDLSEDRMRTARDDLDIFGMRAMMKTLDHVLSDGAAHTPEDIATRLKFAPRHRWLLKRWLGVLTTHGHLDGDLHGSYRLLSPVPVPAHPDLFSVFADLGYPRAVAVFMQKANEHLTALAQDRLRVQELLFADGDMATAHACYRDNIVGHYLNHAAREVITGLVARLDSERSPVRILELGAGVGGTTADVITGLSEMSVDYHFTDLAPFFLTKAKEQFAQYPQIRYGILDLNADLGHEHGYDIVLAANVVHNALHIGRTLRQLRELISPSGVMVFIETCKANYQLLTSLKFLMSASPGQPHPGLSDIRAGARIFLTEEEWLDQLRMSGFTPQLVLPDHGHPLHRLDQRLFVAVRQ